MDFTYDALKGAQKLLLEETTMINRVVEMSYALGELITDAVIKLKDTEGLKEDEYDLWYREQPIWLVRKIKQLSGQDKVEVFRVQVAVFDTKEGIQLQAIPDAYVLEGNEVVARCEPKQIREAILKYELRSLEIVVMKEGREAAVNQIFNTLLWPAWQSANKSIRGIPPMKPPNPDKLVSR